MATKIEEKLSKSRRRLFVRSVKAQNSKRCGTCGQKVWKFGLVYLAGTKKVDGFTLQCQVCTEARAFTFNGNGKMENKVI